MLLIIQSVISNNLIIFIETGRRQEGDIPGGECVSAPLVLKRSPIITRSNSYYQVIQYSNGC